MDSSKPLLLRLTLHHWAKPKRTNTHTNSSRSLALGTCTANLKKVLDRRNERIKALLMREDLEMSADDICENRTQLEAMLQDKDTTTRAALDQLMKDIEDVSV